MKDGMPTKKHAQAMENLGTTFVSGWRVRHADPGVQTDCRSPEHGRAADETLKRHAEMTRYAREGADQRRRSDFGPGAEEVLSAVRLCIGSYQDRPRVAGWMPLSGAELGLPAAFGDAIKFRHGNAEAFIRVGSVGEEKAVAIVFKGTDVASLGDWADNIIHIDRHFDRMRPLVMVIDRYIRTNEITQVLVTGHSLGGAMAERYMIEHPNEDGGPAYVGVTFGSPGISAAIGMVDLRLVEFRHVEDPVPKAGALPLVANYHVPGRVIAIDDRDNHETPILGAVKAHGILAYANSIHALARKGVLFDLLSRPSQEAELVTFGTESSGANLMTLVRDALTAMTRFRDDIEHLAEQSVDETVTFERVPEPDAL